MSGLLASGGLGPDFRVEGMAPGWDRVEVTSPALDKPVILVPLKKGARESSGLEWSMIRSGLRAGTYPFTATSHNRTVATLSLKVAAEGPAEIRRFVIGPQKAFSDAPAPIRPGVDVRVIVTVEGTALGDSLTVRSPVFSDPMTITTNSADDPGCKCDDGGGVVYAGHTRMREDVPEGRYTLTAVSDHGKRIAEQYVTIAGAPVEHGPSWMVLGAVAAGVALAVGGVIAVRRRSRTTASSE
ncbi:hypothetical protein [Streptomyces noursei]|uniref:hypothetical protein n=1 Tax=Streptomyces noursei TaxID=1971 RepID=UPI001E35D3C2|nr:hypothetical protein [Streptomyces noursei]MCZ1012759.1 hypothetical protein [Streptomyces noursei]